MIVLGVDPGSRATGYSIIHKEKGRFKLIEAGTIRTNPKNSIPIRLLKINNELEKIIERTNPTTAAIETIFSGKSAKSALLLGQARGVALMVLAKNNLEVTPYNPMTIKKSVGGHGKAGKKEVIRIVSLLLGLTKDLPSDAADACAIAITHLMYANFANKLRKL
jgi:crossover junction endodeoxyribonuclease RuvC